MKQIFAILLITIAFCFSATAQAKKPALPTNLAKYVNKYPDDLLKVVSVKTRLKILLGKKYSTFDQYIATQMPMTQVGDFLMGTGCLPHSCTISEAAFVIDTKNKRIHAVIYDKGKQPKYYNEDNASTPQALIDWVEDLKKM